MSRADSRSTAETDTRKHTSIPRLGLRPERHPYARGPAGGPSGLPPARSGRLADELRRPLLQELAVPAAAVRDGFIRARQEGEQGPTRILGRPHRVVRQHESSGPVSYTHLTLPTIYSV